jgi:hypothetical protein
MTLKLKTRLAVLAVAVLLTIPIVAQEGPGHDADASNAKQIPWAYSLTTSGYIVPGGQSFVSPDFSADRSRLHLEARYNNEAMRTASLWAGINWSKGQKLVLNLTPMAGVIFGDLNGMAPGCTVSLTRKKFQIYGTAEWVFDPHNASNNYSYLWDQVTYSPRSWLQFGLVSQRTRAYSTGLGVQRGVLVGFTREKVNLTTSIFNFGWTTPTEVLALGFSF